MAINTKSQPGLGVPTQQNQFGSNLSNREAPKEEFFSKPIFCQHELGFEGSSGSFQPLSGCAGVQGKEQRGSRQAMGSSANIPERGQ